MITAFFSKLIAGVSEELLGDLLRALLREILLKRKTADLSKAVDQIEKVIADLEAEQGFTDDEKNAKLIVAGRAAIASLRK